MRFSARALSVAVLCVGLAVVFATSVFAAPHTVADSVFVSAPGTYRAYAASAQETLLTQFYHDGGWRLCPKTCPSRNWDWGADSLTYTLYLRWKTTHDESLVTKLAALGDTAPLYRKPSKCMWLAKYGCTWSDVPNWDLVAMLREYEVLEGRPKFGAERAMLLRKAIAAFDSVETSTTFAGGACPSIRYQQAYGYLDHLKTLETEATAIKGALLLYRFTGNVRYLDAARRHYQAVRAYFLDPRYALYSVFIFDDGSTCRREPQRFFASVNGEMISDGLALSRWTGDATYRDQALATAKAVAAELSDANCTFVDMEADEDIVEPLVEAMFVLATREHVSFAREWLLRNAEAAASARKRDGTYGRFLNGPPNPGMTTAWQTNGGFAIMFAANALAPSQAPTPAAWRDVTWVPHHVSWPPYPVSLLVHPKITISFTGSGIALVGTLGIPFSGPGHAAVLVDGRLTVNNIGIWQGSSALAKAIPLTMLFAWQWPSSGPHTIAFIKNDNNDKEGWPAIDVWGYYVRDGAPSRACSSSAITQSASLVRETAARSRRILPSR